MQRNRGPTKASKKGYSVSRLSDRRQAAGQHADQYLLENQNKIKVDDIFKLTSSSKTDSKQAVTREDPKTGRVWHDSTLVDWNPSHFRMFVGNLGAEVTEDILIGTFARYKSLSKVKIPIDESKKENKGYAFLSFSDANDYLNCYKEMNNKYVGSKPVTLERAKTDIGEVVKVNKRNINNKKNRYSKKRY